MAEPPLTGALVRGLAAAVIAPVLDAVLPAKYEAIERAVARGGLDRAELDELRRTHLAVRQSARQWLAWRNASAGGSSAGAGTETASRSPEIDTETAATMLRRTPRRVVQLIHSGHISARRVGRVWLVDRASVELYR